MKNIVTLTKMACTRISKLASENQSKYVYFYVKGGGCNGFNYHFEPSNDFPDKKDEIIKRDSYDLVVSNESILHLLGTHIDWKKTVMGEGFHFENPMADAKCGCGTSFTSKSS
tara:strand:- start:160 stop:498 length:339 start_codon:yes stop_codon:yes gene_type:complete